MTEPETLLDSILAEHGATAQQLPPLRSGFSWVTHWRDRIEDLISESFKWISQRLHLEQSGWTTPGWIPGLLEIIAYVFVALLIGATIVLAIYLLSKWHRSITGLEPRGNVPFSAQGSLAAEFASAQERGEWGRALRLAWALFLKQRDLPPYLTPAQVTWAPTPELVPRFYAAMFGALTLDQRQFRLFLKELNVPTP